MLHYLLWAEAHAPNDADAGRVHVQHAMHGRHSVRVKLCARSALPQRGCTHTGSTACALGPTG